MDFNMIGRFFRRLSRDADLLGSQFEEADAIGKAAGEGSFTTADTVMKTSRRAYSRKADADVDVDTDSDMWARGDAAGQRSPGLQVGPQVSASGGGATETSRHYSPEASSNGDAMTRALQALADQLASNTARLDTTEKALSAIATYIAQTAKADKFPESEAEDREDDDEDREEESEAAEKSHFAGKPRTATIPQFLDRLSRQSKSPAPPDFTTRKAGQPMLKSMSELLHDREMSLADSLAARDFLSRYNAFQRGMIPANAVLKSTPPAEVAALIDQSSEGRHWRSEIDRMNRRAA